MKLRVFISIPLKDTAGLNSLISDLNKIRGVRTSPIWQIHITLRFIGDVDSGKVPKIEHAVREAVEGIPATIISLKGLGAFPDKKSPRIVWAGVKTELPLADMAEKISDGLRSAKINFDEKEFKPHVTIGRCENRPDLGGLFEKYGNTEFLSFACNSVYVMKSELTPKGAIHSVLAEVKLLQN